MNVEQLIDARLFHEIHVSEIREWQKCEWSWDWKYRNKLYPKKVAKPLEFGTAMHAAMEVLYNPKLWELEAELRELLAYDALEKEINNQKTRAVANFGRFFNDDDQLADYDSRLELGKGILTYYKDVIAPHERDFIPVYTEQSFVVPVVVNGQQMRCACASCIDKLNDQADEIDSKTSDLILSSGGLPVVIEGKIDLVLQYSNGKYWIRDWKNITNFSDNMEWLENDLQLNLYLWALYALDLDIGGFEYFEQRKAYPKAPEPLQRRYKGRLFSTSKTADHEYRTFLDTVVIEDAEAYDAGLYDEYIEWLRLYGPAYHKLTRVKKSVASMQTIDRLVIEYAQRIISTTEPVPSPTKFNCLYCDFRQPCIERMAGSDYQTMLDSNFDTKEKHYYE